MGADFIRLTVVADDNQLDVSLPAQRPVVEYIDDVLDLLAPSTSVGGRTWTLSSPSQGVIDLEDTLADHRIVDGSRLHLTAAPEAAPPPFVDDVLAEMRRVVDARYRSWAGGDRPTWAAAAVGVVVTTASMMIGVADPRWPAVGMLVAGAVFCIVVGSIGRRTGLVRAAWAAVLPAGLAAWRVSEPAGPAEGVVFLLAAVAATVGVAAAVARASSAVMYAATAAAVVFAGVGGAFLAGANPVAVSVWMLPVLVVLMLVGPRTALSSSGLLAQLRLSERMELVEREAIRRGLERGRITADALVWTTSAISVPAVATIALRGVWEQGVAAAVFVLIWLLRSRNFVHTRHVAPMLVAAAANSAFLAAGAARWFELDGAGGLYAVGGGAMLVAAVFALTAMTSLDEVPAARLRRFLDSVDAPLALAFVPVVFFAQGVYSLVWPS